MIFLNLFPFYFSVFFKEARKACKLIRDRFEIDEVIQSFFSLFHYIIFNFQQWAFTKQFNFCILKVEEWLNMCDTDGNGEVSFEEFKFSLMGNLMVEL